MRKKSLAETSPELAAEIHPDSDIKADEVTAGSGKKPLWVCERGHTWRAAVTNRMYGRKCPYCSGSKVLPGFNDLATTNPCLAAQIHPGSEIKADEVTAGSAKKVLWVCKLGHTWRAKISHRSNGSGCPYCSGIIATTGVNDLATVNPKLAAQVHPGSDTRATEVTAFSDKKVLWVCKLGHTWRAKISSRSRGDGCPYCSGKKVLPGFNDLATTNPCLAAQIHPDSRTKASEVTAGSGKKLLWVCELGHTWRAKVCDRSKDTGCPYCSGGKLILGINDLATVNPKLAREVAPESPIKAGEVMAGSGKKLLWMCERDHTWWASVSNRMCGRKCPYCSNKKVLPGFNDLATTNPSLAAEVSLDSPIRANEVTAGSNKKLLWVCERGHAWWAIVNSRTRRGSGCPYCSGVKVLRGFNDLAIANPQLANQVAPNSPIRANEVTEGSTRKLLWICERGHTWRAAVSKRVGEDTGCPYCSGQKVMKGFNDLKTKYPSLAKEVSRKSPIQADEVTCGSSKKLIWKCENDHEWAARIPCRISGRGCPQCAGSQAERDLAELVKTLLPENVKILRNDRKAIKPYELDILAPELDLAFEFNGTYWHSNKMIKKRHPQFESSKAFDDFKKTECAKQGIKLFFVREKPWTENHEKEVKRVEKIVATALKKSHYHAPYMNRHE